jgi:hypothetical protein
MQRAASYANARGEMYPTDDDIAAARRELNIPARANALAPAPVAANALAPAAQPAAPAAQPVVSPVSQAPSDIAAQIKVLEDRRRQLNTLFPDITEAKNESEDLKEQIKVLRDQMKPADVGQDREAFSSQLFSKRYSQLDSTQQAAVNEKIDEKKTYGEEAERISLADYGKTFSRLTQDQRVAVNKKIADAKNQSFGDEAERISLEVYDKPFLQLTTTQRAVVNKRVEDAQGKRGIKIIMPGERVEAKDWIKFEEFVEKQPTFKQTAAMISAAPGVLRVIRQSTSNDFASRALPTSIAKLFDQGTLSNQDVSRYARTGGLDDRLAAMASEFFTGRVTSVTKEQAERFMSAVYRGALIDQKNIYVKQAARLGYADSPNYTTTLKQIDEELAKFREVQPAAPPAAAGRPRTATTGNPLVDKYLNPQ